MAKDPPQALLLENFVPPETPAEEASPRKLRLAAIVAAIIVTVIVITGLVMRKSDDKQLREWTDDQAIPTVAILKPGKRGNVATLDLPGRLEPFSSASLYARVSGYLKSWKVDIGKPVKAGQLLAEIETPDLDQQLLQGKSDLASTEATASLAEITAKRWKLLVDSKYVSKQAADEKIADFMTKQALAQSARANVDRLKALKNFARIVAPFDGIVTARGTDIGALINGGSGSRNGPGTLPDIEYEEVACVCQRAADLRTKYPPQYPGKNHGARASRPELRCGRGIFGPSGRYCIRLDTDADPGR